MVLYQVERGKLHEEGAAFASPAPAPTPSVELISELPEILPTSSPQPSTANRESLQPVTTAAPINGTRIKRRRSLALLGVPSQSVADLGEGLAVAGAEAPGMATLQLPLHTVRSPSAAMYDLQGNQQQPATPGELLPTQPASAELHSMPMPGPEAAQRAPVEPLAADATVERAPEPSPLNHAETPRASSQIIDFCRQMVCPGAAAGMSPGGTAQAPQPSEKQSMHMKAAQPNAFAVPPAVQHLGQRSEAGIEASAAAAALEHQAAGPAPLGSAAGAAQPSLLKALSAGRIAVGSLAAAGPDEDLLIAPNATAAPQPSEQLPAIVVGQGAAAPEAGLVEIALAAPGSQPAPGPIANIELVDKSGKKHAAKLISRAAAPAISPGWHSSSTSAELDCPLKCVA